MRMQQHSQLQFPHVRIINVASPWQNDEKAEYHSSDNAVIAVLWPTS